VAQIRTTVEDCEAHVAEIPMLLRLMAEKFERIDHVLSARGEVPIQAYVAQNVPPEAGVTLSDNAATALTPPAPEEA
jgi:hypothetical protein